MIRPITQEQRDKIGDRRVVASISGGKDSCALSLWLSANGIEHDRIFADTGWEHPATYHYLREVLPSHIGAISWLQPKLGFQDLAKKKGMFPSRIRRFCSQKLKLEPIVAYFSERLNKGEECANAIGIRGEESEDRAKMPEWEWAFDEAETWRPLLGWTEDDVISYLREHDCPPNPLYLKGASRVGCWPCIFANKFDLRLLANTDPERVSEIERLEAEVGAAALLRAVRKGKTLDNLPTFFQAREREEGEEKRSGRSVPISDVIEWAKTDRGGSQFLLLEKEAPGCMKWGLCE